MTLPEFDDDISVVTFLSEEAAKALREAQAKLEQTVDQAIVLAVTRSVAPPSVDLEETKSTLDETPED